MPRATVRVELPIGCLRQRQVHRPAFLRGRRSVHRRAHERMTERHPLADRQQPVRSRAIRGRRPRCRGARPRATSRSGSPTGSAAATSSRRRASSGSASSRRTKLSSIRPDSACAPSSPNPPASSVARQPARQLEQRERVAARLRDDPVAHPLVQHEPHRRAQQRPRVAVAKAAHLQLGHVPKLLARFTCSEHDPDRLGQQPPSHERQRQGRRLIQPLRVIDDAQQRTLLGHLREQAQHRQPDDEPVRGRTSAQPEHDLERLALRARKPARADRSIGAHS